MQISMRTTDALQSGLRLRWTGPWWRERSWTGSGTAGQEEREKKSQHRITGGRKCIGIYVPVGRGKHDGMGLLEGTAGRE